MLDWDTLRTVLAVHRMGGLSGAARDLQVSQPTVSRRLAKAEADLETKLFDRSQGRLIATEAGLIVVRETEQVEQRLRRMEDSVRQLDNDVSGMLTISAPQQFFAVLHGRRNARLSQTAPGHYVQRAHQRPDGRRSQ